MADGSTHDGGARRGKVKTVLQTEAAECSMACLTMVARSLGHDIDLAAMRRRFDTSLRGMNLGKMIEIARILGLDARPLRAELPYLRQARLPCILHWDLNHFVVLSRVSGRGLHLHDPAHGERIISLEQASAHFTGVLVEFTRAAQFEPVRDRKRISLRSLAGRIEGVSKVAFQLLGLATVIELLAILLPFQIQWTVDEVIPTADMGLLMATGAGFIVLIVLQCGLSIARGWTLSRVGASLGEQLTTRLFSHMLRLPLDFFQKRRMGDVISRFGSLQTIQNTLTGAFVEAVLDGIVGCVALAIMATYSGAMTAVVLASVCLYAVLRATSFRLLRNVNEEQLIHIAKQQSLLMESIRAMQAIKLACREADRNARLANATAEAAGRTMRSQRIGMTFSALAQGLVGIQRVVLVMAGGYLVIREHVTAGMLVAFIAYADQFSTKVSSLVDKVVDFSMLHLHAERVADIAYGSPEPWQASEYSGPDPLPSLDLSDIGYRYSASEPWVIRHLDLAIAEGESIAITGVSGAGKSTLARLIVGLHEPVEGRIRVGGIDLAHLGFARYRSLVAAVMQDDQLLDGTLGENIAFFDHAASLDTIIRAAQAARIHDEIIRMPMGYETRVGDMGSSLSGGQLQRVLLARALYRKPRILVLDEATSHLDVDNERAINAAIRELAITRIIIAHRAETIASADRVFELKVL